MYEGIIQDLIDELGRLPGVGPKSAQRIAFHIIASDRVDVTRLAEVLKTVKERVKFCTTCGNISEEDLCRICRDPRRDNTSICVVEESKDVIAIEKTRNAINFGELITIESITGSTFKGSLVREEKFGPFKAVIPQVEGTAFVTGVNTFLIDPKDPMKNGFILR